MEKNREFLSPKLEGERFATHTIPLSILEDFSALEELLLALAKQIYLDENQNRRRVPKGFGDNVRLSVSHIGEGSAIPKILLIYSLSSISTVDVDSANIAYVEKAKEKVIEIIDSANTNKKINLDPKFLGYFNRIGKNLLDDESIDFLPDSDKSAILNKDTRKAILLSRAEKHEYSVSSSFNAFVSSIDKGQEKFKLDIEGNVIECSFETAGDFIRTIYTGFNEHENNTLLSIKATGIYNEHDKLIKIEAIEAMDVLDPFDVKIRLNYLSKLEDKWYDGDGKAPEGELLNKFGEYFTEYYDGGLKLPSIFPTIEGNIQLEWAFPRANVFLEVFLDDFKSEFLIANSNNTFEELELNLINETDWGVINNKIKGIINE